MIAVRVDLDRVHAAEGSARLQVEPLPSPADAVEERPLSPLHKTPGMPSVVQLGKGDRTSESHSRIDGPRIGYTSEIVNGSDRLGQVASWSLVPTLDWASVATVARGRMAGATRKLRGSRYVYTVGV